MSRSGDYLGNRFRVLDADEVLVQAAIEEAEAVGVEAELATNRGVEVLHLERVLDGLAAALVGLADADTALDSAAIKRYGLRLRALAGFVPDAMGENRSGRVRRGRPIRPVRLSASSRRYGQTCISAELFA
jgi:hypothetical protein